MNEILKKIQVHVPFRLLHDKLMPIVINRGINPEIGFDHAVFELFCQRDFVEVAKGLSDAGISPTFHAPFLDLRPGALDPKVRQATIDRLKEFFDLVPFFQPRLVVCHPAFDERYYMSGENIWLENSLETWGYFSTLAGDMHTVIALENVYEADPLQLRLLLSGLNSPNVCFCFDTGHFNVFSRASLEVWMEEMLHFLGEIHIHDNHGTVDEHLPVGMGSFPFLRFFRMIRNNKDSSLIVTIEAHSEKNLWQSLENIKSMQLLDG
jgi:sugar phosphate isomerase/epimerase